MDRITVDWLPDDAPWENLTWFTKEELKTQCAKRNLPVAGNKSILQQRLLDYQRTHTTEVRSRPWRLQLPAPDETDYGCWHKHPLPIRLVEDLSNSRGCLKMRFTFASPRIKHSNSHLDAFAQVYFTNKPSCSCGKHFLQGFPCLHIEYLFRKVLNCPEPLLWQEAFLTSELEYIYNHSHAALSRVKPDRYRQGKKCVICFAVHKTHERNVPCSACGMPMHPLCIKVFKSERRSASVEAGQCLLCVDKAAWAVEKYFGRPQVSPAAPVPVSVAQASIQALARSDRRVEDGIQPSIEAVSPDSIQRRITLKELQSAAQQRWQRCTSTPLPGVPSLVWQEMQQQAREQQEQQQEQQQRQQQGEQQQQQQTKKTSQQQRKTWQQRKKKTSGSEQAAKPVVIPVVPKGEYEVEAIIDSMIDAETMENLYFVKWKGYPSSDNTWEPKQNIQGATELLRKFNADNKAKKFRVSGLPYPPQAKKGERNGPELDGEASQTAALHSLDSSSGPGSCYVSGSGSGHTSSPPQGPVGLAALVDASISARTPTDDVQVAPSLTPALGTSAQIIVANSAIAATAGETDFDTAAAPAASNVVNFNNKIDRKAAKLARKRKRLENKRDHLERDANYHFNKAKKNLLRIERVEKRIRKTEKKAKKRALARRMEGLEDGTE